MLQAIDNLPLREIYIFR